MTTTVLPSGQIVYDPRGQISVEPVIPARRPSSLEGIRLGILTNSKWNASRLLRRVVAHLEVIYSFRSVRQYSKTSFSSPADSTLFDQIAKEVDVVITAIGD
tara:strand:- start:185 stop:490 length:306 start_codon:yes stop_codon:yes gene_type:complete